MVQSQNEFPTILGEDAVFKGELRFEKGMKLLGKFEGQITSDGQNVVAEGAALTGDAKAGTIRVGKCPQFESNVPPNEGTIGWRVEYNPS